MHLFGNSPVVQQAGHLLAVGELEQGERHASVVVVAGKVVERPLPRAPRTLEDHAPVGDGGRAGVDCSGRVLARRLLALAVCQAVAAAGNPRQSAGIAATPARCPGPTRAWANANAAGAPPIMRAGRGTRGARRCGT